jgi:hypothetical protein
VAARGVHHQARWFVDHDQVRVFVQNLEGDAGVGRGRAGRRLTRLDLELGAAAHLLLLTTNLAVHFDAAFADPTLHRGA